MREKIAVITGASRGIGKAIAIYLAELGYIVILLARNKKLLENVSEEINKKGGKASYIPIDVANSSQVKTYIEQIITQYGYIDLLINNAAILKRGTTDITDDDVDELLKINLNGAIYVAKHVATQMKKQRDGYIINISSLGGKVAASFAGIYAASKFGLSGYSEALSKEMSLYGVKVTSICPSMVATEMAAGRKFELHKMIQIEDMTRTVGYLLSLSKNAIPTEILLSCLPLIEKTTESLMKMYLC